MPRRVPPELPSARCHCGKRTVDFDELVRLMCEHDAKLIAEL